MRSFTALPEGYREILHIDLQKDKKLMLLVNVLACVIMIVMFAVSICIVPLSTLFRSESEMYIKCGVLIAGYILYMVLHEAVHGVFMRRYCDAKVRYGFTGAYAFAASEGYFCRRDYIVIALAPIVILGIVLVILNFLVPYDWFYVVYFIQAGNISGAAGDLYITWKMSRLPADILVNDTGVAMTVYSREG